MKVCELAERIARGDPWLTHHHAVLVVDEQGLLDGIITRGDIAMALQADPSGQTNVKDAGTSPPVVAYPDELIFEAVQRLLEHRIGRLPVVSRGNPRLPVGYFGRTSALASLVDRYREEQEREAPWTPWRRRRRGVNAKTQDPTTPGPLG